MQQVFYTAKIDPNFLFNNKLKFDKHVLDIIKKF